MPLGTDRLLADIYGATFQRLVAPDGQLSDSYVSQLRFDSLFARKVVIPDAHILDGPFFLSVSPATLAEAIGRGQRERHLPLEIRCRSPLPAGSRIADSLRNLLFRADSKFLNTYAFNAIDDPQTRVALASELGRIPADRLHARLDHSEPEDVPTELAKFLMAIAGPDAEQDLIRMAAGWSAWVTAEKSGAIHTVPWDRDFDLPGALRAEPFDHTVLHTDAGREVLTAIEAVLARSRHRSDLTMIFEEARRNFGWRTDADTDPNDLEAKDLRDIDRWYSRARYLAAARQHDADISYVFDPVAAPQNNAERRALQIERGSAATDVVLADELLPGLALMADEEFGRFTQMHRATLATIWHGGTPRDVRKLVQELGAWLDRLDLPSARSGRRLGRFTWISLVAGPAAGLGAQVAVGPEALSSVATASLAAGAALTGATVDYMKSRPQSVATRRVLQYLRSRVQSASRTRASIQL
jgi:hypothetical protein